MTIQQLLLAGGAVANTGVLDSNTTSLWGAYGLVRLRSNYNGNCLLVRRSSDNATQAIGFVNNAIDTASMLTFVGANDGFVVTWYDQSGGANDITQATAAKQPQIVDTGAYTYELLFDGTNDVLTTTNSSGTPTGFSLYMAGRARWAVQGASATTGRIFSQGQAADAQVRLTTDTTNYRFNSSTNAGTVAYSALQYSPATLDNTTYAFIHDRTQGSVQTQSKMYAAGTLIGFNSSSGSLATSTFPASVWSIGAVSDATLPLRMGCQCAVIYETAHAAGTVTPLSALIVPSVRTDTLDAYTTSLWGVYSLRRQRSNFAGSCLRVRRASDSTESDIGFVSGVIDTATLATFCAATNGFVTKWYDQSGGTNDLIQATAVNQPQIFSSSTGYLGLISFDGSNDVLSTANNSGTPTAFTAFLRVNARSLLDTIVLEHSSNYSLNNSIMIEPGAAANQIQVGVHGTGGGGGYAASRFSMNALGQVFGLSMNRANVTGATVARGFNGGALMTRDAGADSGTLPSGAFDAKAWNLGARNGGGGATALDAFDLVIYETATSDANIERISRLLG